MTEKETRDDAVVQLEHGKPLVFGKAKDKGIRLNGTELEVIQLRATASAADDCLVWDETRPNPAIAFLVGADGRAADFPTPIGVLRAVELPTYEERVVAQIQRETEQHGVGSARRPPARRRHLDRPRRRHDFLASKPRKTPLKEEDGRAAARAQPEFLGWRRGSGGDRLALHAAARSGVMLELFEVGAPTPTRTVALEPDATSATPIRLWRTELSGLPERFEYLVRLDDGTATSRSVREAARPVASSGGGATRRSGRGWGEGTADSSRRRRSTGRV